MKDKRTDLFDEEIQALWRSGTSSSKADEILDAVRDLGMRRAPSHLKERLKRAEFDSERRRWFRFALPVAVPAAAALVIAFFLPSAPHRNIAPASLPTPVAEMAALNEADEEFVLSMLDYDMDDLAEPVEADVVDLEDVWS
jgi:hypothetical protein